MFQSRETSISIVEHDPKHGLILKEQMDALGIECHVVHPENRGESPQPIAFLIEHVKHPERR